MRRATRLIEKKGSWSGGEEVAACSFRHRSLVVRVVGEDSAGLGRDGAFGVSMVVVIVTGRGAAAVLLVLEEEGC